MNRYSVDRFNRLVIKSQGESMVARGSFEIDKRNRLAYLLGESPAWRRKYGFSNRINFTGNWRLTADNNLELKLDNSRGQSQGDTLVLKGQLVRGELNTLLFEIHGFKTDFDSNEYYFRLLKLSGLWQSDDSNRISFSVSKDSSGVLLFKGTWELDKNQQICYIYEKKQLATKTNSTSSIVIDGYWQIDSQDKLTYYISGNSRNKFEFKAHLESLSMYPQDGAIKYRVGIGYKTKKNVTLYGEWKFGRNLGLDFEMDYAKGAVNAIKFGAEVNFSKAGDIKFLLTSKSGDKLGAELIFTRKLLEKSSAEAFLRLRRIKGESGIDAGVRIPF